MWLCTVLVAIYSSFRFFFYKSWLCVYYCRWMSSTVFSCDSSLFHVLIRVTDLVHTSAEKYACCMSWVSLVKPTKMSWNLLNIWSWNFTFCSWDPCSRNSDDPKCFTYCWLFQIGVLFSYSCAVVNKIPTDSAPAWAELLSDNCSTCFFSIFLT